MLYGPGCPEGMRNGEYHGENQGKLHLGVDPDDGWTSELVWRTGSHDCSFNKVILP